MLPAPKKEEKNRGARYVGQRGRGAATFFDVGTEGKQMVHHMLWQIVDLFLFTVLADKIHSSGKYRDV